MMEHDPSCSLNRDLSTQPSVGNSSLSWVQAVDRNQGRGSVQFMTGEEFEMLLNLELERYEWRPCTCIRTFIDRFFC